jgi:hypothetical protein
VNQDATKLALSKIQDVMVKNLNDESAERLIAADMDDLMPILGSSVRGSTSAPFCDVLSIYCEVAPDGRIGNFPGTLRDLMQALRAPLVVVASEKPGDDMLARQSVAGATDFHCAHGD